jgi:signal transduction histidine kinase
LVCVLLRIEPEKTVAELDGTRRAVRSAALLAAVYAVVGKLSLMLGAVGGFATLVWPPTGISLAALLLLGYRVLPGVLVGAFVVNVWAGAPALVAVGIAVGNTAEAVLGAYAMRRLGSFQGLFDRLRHVIVLLVPVATLSTLVSATVGVGSLALAGIVARSEVLLTWRAWWVGDMLGDLVVAPLLLTWATVREPKATPQRWLEMISVVSLVAAASVLVFFRTSTSAGDPFESPYVLYPLFVWAAVRFELRGAATVTALASVIAVWGTARGLGPFPRATLADSLLALQTFMGSAAFTPLVVAGAVADRARAIRVRESFAATVSHDLRNPIGAIQLSTATLAKALPAEGRVQKNWELVRRNVSRMVRLIGDLQDAAALEAGRITMERREEEVPSLVKEAVDTLAPHASAKHQTLVAEDVESINVLVDRQRMLQVLANLLENAVKFTKDGGSIRVRAKRAGHAVHFSVKDSGVGIEPAQLGHVFERYWHERPAAGGGTGLGLFITKGIVEAHGGKVWVESRLGEGSTFHFTLPPIEELPARRPAGHDGRSMAAITGRARASVRPGRGAPRGVQPRGPFPR